MADNININGLTLRQILDLYSSEKLKKTIAGGTFSARMGNSAFRDACNTFLPGRHDNIELDPEALAAIFSRLVDEIDER